MSMRPKDKWMATSTASSAHTKLGVATAARAPGVENEIGGALINVVSTGTGVAAPGGGTRADAMLHELLCHLKIDS